jgi:hypothetical protein
LKQELIHCKSDTLEQYEAEVLNIEAKLRTTKPFSDSGKRSMSFLGLRHRLDQIILLLDDIQAMGDGELKANRKKLVQHILGILERCDALLENREDARL